MKSLIEEAQRLLGPLFSSDRFCVSTSDDQTSGWAAVVRLDAADVQVMVVRERGIEWVEVCCKVRPGPRRQLRSYSIGSLSAFVAGEHASFPAGDLASDAERLLQHEALFLSPAFLNSEDLHRWRVRDSQRQFAETNA